MATDRGHDRAPTGGRNTRRRHQRLPRRIADDVSAYVSLPSTDSGPSTQGSAFVPAMQASPYVPSTCEDVSYVPSTYPYVPYTQDRPFGPSTYEPGDTSTQHVSHCHDDIGETQPPSQDLHNEFPTNTDTDSDDDDTLTQPLQDDVDDGSPTHIPDGRRIIKPAGNTFLPSTESSHAITEVIRKNFKKPWITWKEVKKNDDDSKMMLSSFSSIVGWKKEHTAQIKKNFHQRASRQMSDMLSDVRQKMEKPKYIGQSIWDQMLAKWAKADWKKASERGKANRASTKGGSLHTGGSLNTAQIPTNLEKMYRRPVQLNELHRHMHVRKDTDSGEEQFVDQRSREVQEQYHQAMNRYHAEQAASGSDPQSNPEELGRVELDTWVDTTGGKKKGRVYGAGSLSSCYRRGVSYLDINSTSTSSAASTGHSHDMEWQRKLEEASRMAEMTIKENQELPTQVEQQRQSTQVIEQHMKENHDLRTQMEQQRQTTQMMEQQMKQMMEMMQQQQQWRPESSSAQQFYPQSAWAFNSQLQGGPSSFAIPQFVRAPINWPVDSQQHGGTWPSQPAWFFSQQPLSGPPYYYGPPPGQQPQAGAPPPVTQQPRRPRAVMPQQATQAGQGILPTDEETTDLTTLLRSPHWDYYVEGQDDV